MARETMVELTNMCMVTDGTRVLVQDRAKKDWPGIALPGGHVEPGESFTQSVIREVKEETGLTIENPRLGGIKNVLHKDGARYLVMLFKADRFSGELCSSEEGRVFWVEKDELPNMRLSRSVKEVIALLEDDSLSELLGTPDGDDIRWELL